MSTSDSDDDFSLFATIPVPPAPARTTSLADSNDEPDWLKSHKVSVCTALTPVPARCSLVGILWLTLLFSQPARHEQSRDIIKLDSDSEVSPAADAVTPSGRRRAAKGSEKGERADLLRDTKADDEEALAAGGLLSPFVPPCKRDPTLPSLTRYDFHPPPARSFQLDSSRSTSPSCIAALNQPISLLLSA